MLPFFFGKLKLSNVEMASHLMITCTELAKKFVFFHKIKDTFSPITLLIWIFWVYWLSPTWCYIDCSWLMSWFDRYQLQLFYLTMEHHPSRYLQHAVSQITFDTFDQSQHLLHTLHKSFVCVFELRFYLSWNNKA